MLDQKKMRHYLRKSRFLLTLLGVVFSFPLSTKFCVCVVVSFLVC
jgi:hypothetical protein